MIFNNILETIGNTPTIRCEIPLVPEGKELFLQMEQYNPSLSVKDRTALGLITQAIESGKLKKGGRIIESTSGNLGKALSMIGAVMGIKVMVVIDPKIGKREENWMRALGAEVVLVSKPDAQGGYQKPRIAKVKELLARYPDAYWSNQYDNPDNPRTHYQTTGPELIDLPVDAVCGAVSTGGHLSGTAKYFKEKKPHVKIIACDVEGSAIFGDTFKPYLVGGVGLAWKSKNTDTSLFDATYTITDQQAISMCHYVARQCGILMGGSGGLACYGALKYLYESNVHSVLVIVPDTGTNYLNTIYDFAWLTEHQIALSDKKRLIEELSS